VITVITVDEPNLGNYPYVTRSLPPPYRICTDM
jgi:hypothetical protein